MIRKKSILSWMIQVSILSAISVVLYNFPKFQLPIFPSFLSVQFSMLPALIGTFALGPVGGVVIVVIKFLFKLLTTRSAGVGELADLLLGLIVVIVVGIIYMIKRNKKTAFISLLVGIGAWTLSALLLNYVLLIPTYAKLYGLKAVLGLLKVIPGVTEANYMSKYLLYACLPFNLMLSIVVSLVTLLVYKRISFLFEKMNSSISKNKKVQEQEIEETSEKKEGNKQIPIHLERNKRRIRKL